MTEIEVQSPAWTLDSSWMNEHGMDKRNYSVEQLDGILSLQALKDLELTWTLTLQQQF